MKCPSFEQLIDYLDSRLSLAETEAASAHLASGCKACAEVRAWYEHVREIATGDESVEPPAWVVKRAVRIFDNQPARPRLVERITERIASLVFDSLARPSVVGVRSTETTNRQLLYQAGDYSIDLQVAPSEHRRADLIGQVLREGESSFESVAGLELKLMLGGRTVRSTTTDQMGEFKISEVDCAAYDLTVRLPEGSITVQGLPIAEAP